MEAVPISFSVSLARRFEANYEATKWSERERNHSFKDSNIVIGRVVKEGVLAT